MQKPKTRTWIWRGHIRDVRDVHDVRDVRVLDLAVAMFLAEDPLQMTVKFVVSLKKSFCQVPLLSNTSEEAKIRVKVRYINRFSLYEISSCPGAKVSTIL